LIFDKGIVKFELLNNYKNEEAFVSVIFGETCDSMDKIIEGAELPELACGDYLYVENHCAYTLASSSSFNGFHVGKPLYVFTY
jgi:ornithine decarboxylase